MKQITLGQRYEIAVLKQQNYSNIRIAEVVGFNKSTIGRELKRNADLRNGDYKPALAQRKATERHHDKPKVIRFTSEVKDFVIQKLKEDFSPEQIVGYAQRYGIRCISIESIYRSGEPSICLDRQKSRQ